MRCGISMRCGIFIRHDISMIWICMHNKSYCLHGYVDQLLFCIMHICDQICQKGSYTRTVSGFTFHYHSADTTMTNSWCLYHCQIFNGLLLLRSHSQACLASTDAWVVCKWFQLADSRQGITTGLADKTRHRCSYILRHVELKTARIEATWP